MTIYVQIRDGAVINRIVADGPLPPEWFAEGENWAENEEAQIGWSHDGEVFAPPPREPEPPPGPVIVPYGAFLARWDDAELEALFGARKTDWRVDNLVTLAAAQDSVNLSGPLAAAARDLFVALGVLSAERAAAIFAAD